MKPAGPDRKPEKHPLTFEAAMESIVRGTAAVGEGFFRALVRELATCLDMAHVHVAEIPPEAPGRARTVAVWCDGEPAADYEYDLAHTPGQEIFGETLYACPVDVCERFPLDHNLRELGAVAYLGAPLSGGDGTPLGLIAAIARRPLAQTDWHHAALTIFAARAGAELERLRADRLRSRLEPELRAAQKLEAIGTWAGGIAHDFNNILGAIVCNADLVRMEASDQPAVLDSAEQILRASQRAKELVSQLLAMVHDTVRSHQGAIRVRSQPGDGTTFEVFLPALDQRPDALKPDPAGATATQRPRVLFIDDEVELCQAAGRMLEHLGFIPTVHSDPEHALADFRREPGAFDVVLTDLTMPGMTGLDLARQILLVRPHMPVLLATGHDAGWTRDTLQALGVGDVVVKPVSLEELGRALSRVLATSAARTAVALTPAESSGASPHPSRATRNLPPP